MVSDPLMAAVAHAPRVVVLDTNIVLDLWLFQDPAHTQLAQALSLGQLQWVAMPLMQQELAWVLARESSQHWAAKNHTSCDQVADMMAQLCRFQPDDVPPSGLRCKDATDQPFVDLAVAKRALLISKDKAVLRLAGRLALKGVGVGVSWDQAMQRCRPAHDASIVGRP